MAQQDQHKIESLVQKSYSEFERKDLNRAQRLEIIRRLSKRQTGKFVRAALIDWILIIGLSIAASYINTWWAWVMLVILFGPIQHGLGILTHDAAHYLAAENKTLNDFLGNISFGWPLFFSLKRYREGHLRHHRFLGSSEDPELSMYKIISAPWGGWSVPATIKKIFVHALFRSRHEMAKVMMNILRVQGYDSIPCLAWWLCAGLLGYYGGISPLVAVCWMIAFPTSQWTVFVLRVYTEHIGTPDTHYVYFPLYARWIVPHQVWRHLMHHVHPSIPFYNLSQAEQLLLSKKLQRISFWDLLQTYKHYHSVPTGTFLRTL